MRRLLSSADFAHALPRIHRRTRGDLLLRRRSHRTWLPKVFAIRGQLRSAVVRGAYHRDVQRASSRLANDPNRRTHGPLHVATVPLGAEMSHDGRHPSDRAPVPESLAPRPAFGRPAHRARKSEPQPARPRVARRLRSSSARQACSDPSRRHDEAERGARGPPAAARARLRVSIHAREQQISELKSDLADERRRVQHLEVKAIESSRSWKLRLGRMKSRILESGK